MVFGNGDDSAGGSGAEEGAAQSGGRAGSIGNSSTKVDAGAGDKLDAAAGADAAKPIVDAPNPNPVAKVDAAPMPDLMPKVDARPAAPVLSLRSRATEDTFVQGDSDTDTHGKDSFMLVKYRPNEQNLWREAYVRFDLQNVTALSKASLVISARMSNASTTTVLEVRGLSGDWGEEQTSWATMRPVVGDVLAMGKVPEQQPATLTFDVTAYVTAATKLRATSVAFAFTQEVASAYDSHERFEIASKESGDTGPTLVITP